jgi:predicted nucleic acid-binding protein
MPFVLDASVVLAWLLPDEQSELAEGLISRVAQDRAFAPSLLLLEVGNALLQAQRRARVPAAARKELLAAFTTLPVILEPISADSMLRAGKYAEDHGLSLYDGCYLELAGARGYPLATLDRGLVKAARVAGVAVLGGK